MSFRSRFFSLQNVKMKGGAISTSNNMHVFSTIPTECFTILEPQNLSTEGINTVQKRRSTDFEVFFVETFGRVLVPRAGGLRVVVWFGREYAVWF